MVHTGKKYFLSRPRRFGKSLFISSLKAYWEGKKDLFEGCRILNLEADHPDAWEKYPVFLFDFNGKNYREKGALELLDGHSYGEVVRMTGISKSTLIRAKKKAH